MQFESMRFTVVSSSAKKQVSSIEAFKTYKTILNTTMRRRGEREKNFVEHKVPTIPEVGVSRSWRCGFLSSEAMSRRSIVHLV